MLKICITFDYELFLGANYVSDEQVLFEPSKKISDVLLQEKIQSTFFVDVCSVFQHQKYGLIDYVEQFKKQICELSIAGHDIQLHLHPNWLNCKYDNGKWIMSPNGYKLHSWGLNEGEKGWELISQGKKFLEETICKYNTSYKCMAFRAGGFCIQPEKEIINVLINNGIYIDSSIACNQVAFDSIQDYNFMKIPHYLSWWIDRERGINTPAERSDHALLEISIGGVKNNIPKYFGIPINELKVKGRDGIGEGIRLQDKNNMRILTVLRNICRHINGKGILSLDTRGHKVLKRDIDELYRNYNCKKADQYVCIICHPKLASDAVIENMREFIRKTSLEPDKYMFLTLRDIARENHLL